MNIEIDKYLYGKKNNQLFLEDVHPSEENSNILNFEEYYYSIYHFITLKGSHSPRQGWKVHISCTRENFQSVLDVVYGFCVDNNTSFKFIYNKSELMYYISGSCPPSQLGKFITIYPNDRDDFVFIVSSLYDLLEGYEGPYVLSDKRYKNSNIYYRYGIIESSSDFLITPAGEKILDDRSYFKVPDFETDPLATEEETLQLVEGEFIEKTVFPTIIKHLSASGNVYSAMYLEKNSILKEARPFVLGVHGSAVDDLKNEVKILNLLEEIPGIPEMYKTFTEWENYYVIEQEIPGSSFLESRADITIDNDVQIEKIVEGTIELVESIHKKNVVINDISANNFLLCRDVEPHVWICDFGSSYINNEKEKLSNNVIGTTEGYYDSSVQTLSAFDADFHKLGYVLMNYIFPSNRLNLIDKTGDLAIKQFNSYCEDLDYPTNIVQIVNLLIKQPKGWRQDVKTLINTKTSQLNIRGQNKNTKKQHGDLISELEKCLEQQTNAIKVVKEQFSDQYYITSQQVDFFHVLNGFFIPSLITSNVTDNIKIPDKLIFGGIKNSNLAFLFNYPLKAEFFSKKSLYEEDLIRWLKDSKDISLSNGVLGFGIILLLADNHNEFDIETYMHLIEEKINNHTNLFKEGESLGIDGCLGMVYFEILLYKRTKNSINLNKAIDGFNRIKKHVLNYGDDKNVYFPSRIGGKVSSPYVMDGLAGYIFIALELYMCEGLPTKIKDSLKEDVIFPCVNTLKSEKWAQYPGFLDGLSGIAYVIFRAGQTFKNDSLVSESISMLLNVQSFALHKDSCSFIPEKLYQNFTFDIESGNAGVIYVIKEVLEYIQMERSNEECICKQ